MLNNSRHPNHTTNSFKLHLHQRNWNRTDKIPRAPPLDNIRYTRMGPHHDPPQTRRSTQRKKLHQNNKTRNNRNILHRPTPPIPRLVLRQPSTNPHHTTPNTHHPRHPSNNNSLQRHRQSRQTLHRKIRRTLPRIHENRTRIQPTPRNHTTNTTPNHHIIFTKQPRLLKRKKKDNKIQGLEYYLRILSS